MSVFGIVPVLASIAVAVGLTGLAPPTPARAEMGAVVSQQPAMPSVMSLAQSRGPRPAPTAAASGEGDVVQRINEWTVGLATGLPQGTYLRIGAEIARNLNERGELRVLPIVTLGATENVRDLLYLKGIDIAITATDVFEHFRTIEKIPNIERRINYVTGMYVSEVHILARPEYKTLKDLEGKKVGFHTKGAGSSTTAPIVFRRLGITVEPVYINNAIAIEKMKTGEIAAIVNNGGKPASLFTNFKNDQGFHFLEIPFEKFDDYYVPSVLTEKDYPNIVKPGQQIDTLAVPAVLAVYNWPRTSDRFRRVSRFIERFFEQFDEFKQQPYHPSWKTINLAAKVPGWSRYWVAEEKLKELAPAAAAAPSGIDRELARRQAARVAPNDPKKQEELFKRFLEWANAQQR